VDWLWPEQAFAIFKAAGEIDPELEAYLTTLCYTGMRLGEATVLMLCSNVSLADGFAFVPYTKNGDPRPVHLPPVLVAALANHPRGLDRGGQTVFKFRKGGHLYRLLGEVNRRSGLAGVTFHTFRHTYGTWMRRYGGLDTKGLVDTGTWRSEKAASRYAHTVASEEAQRANVLPTMRLLK
jgi:integrase